MSRPDGAGGEVNVYISYYNSRVCMWCDYHHHRLNSTFYAYVQTLNAKHIK